MRFVKLGLLFAAQAAAAWGIVVFVITPALRGEPLPWQKPAVEEEEAAVAEGDGTSRELGPLLQLDGILVNVAETKGRRYFKTSMTLEMEGKELGKTAEERMPILRGAVIDLLSKKTLEQLVEPTARDSLRTEILGTLNAQVSGGQFRDLFFTEFLVQ
jgi:flagellar FliL protein